MKRIKMIILLYNLLYIRNLKTILKCKLHHKQIRFDNKIIHMYMIDFQVIVMFNTMLQSVDNFLVAIESIL